MKQTKQSTWEFKIPLTALIINLKTKTKLFFCFFGKSHVLLPARSMPHCVPSVNSIICAWASCTCSFFFFVCCFKHFLSDLYVNIKWCHWNLLIDWRMLNGFGMHMTFDWLDSLFTPYLFVFQTYDLQRNTEEARRRKDCGKQQLPMAIKLVCCV